MIHNPQNPQVIIYTDGACKGNPGPGGYGAVLIYGQHQKQIKAGYRHSTNNRMEILATIISLESLKKPCSVKLYSDSKYVVDAMNKGWPQRWQRNNWMRNKDEKAKNYDLWQRLLAIDAKHQVQYLWVKGHSGDEFNELADALAVEAAEDSATHLKDEFFEKESGINFG